MRVRLPLVPAAAAAIGALVGAVLLTGCAGEPEAASPKPTASVRPTPSPTPSTSTSSTSTSSAPSPTPTAPASVDPGPAVIQWYHSGGEKLLHGLISSARSARAEHEADEVVIDLTLLSSGLEEARSYSVPYIPDAKTHETWTKAREHLSSGMALVLSASRLSVSPMNKDKAAEASAAGWADIGQGIAGLKETDDRLRAMGCLPTKDPWK